jgi:hypothetical protein
MAQTMAIVKPAVLPAEAAELHPFRQAGSAYAKASLLLFKDGTYTDNETGAKITGTAIVIMNECAHGWIRWEDKRPIAHRIDRVIDAPYIAKRATLGDLDETKWPFGLSGAREDPWVHTIIMPLLVNGAPLSFTSRTFGGRGAFYSLLKKFGWQGIDRPDQYPVIELGSETFHTRFGGDKQKPVFTIVGWADRPDAGMDSGDMAVELDAEIDAQPPAKKGGTGDMDDEIPF